MAVRTTDKEKYSKLVAGIKVIPLNMDAINADIDKNIKDEAKKAGTSSFAPRIKPDEYFKIKGKFGVILGTNILVDDECIGECIESHASMDVYSETRDENGKVTSWGMFPRFTCKQTLADLLKEFAMPEIGLEEFMGNRFAYNGRIIGNINEIVAEYKKQTK